MKQITAGMDGGFITHRIFYPHHVTKYVRLWVSNNQWIAFPRRRCVCNRQVSCFVFIEATEVRQKGDDDVSLRAVDQVLAGNHVRGDGFHNVKDFSTDVIEVQYFLTVLFQHGDDIFEKVVQSELFQVSFSIDVQYSEEVVNSGRLLFVLDGKYKIDKSFEVL